MVRQRPPDYLPAEVLAREDFIAACADRDLGAIFRVAKKWGGVGFTASHLARRCEMSVSRVQEYVKGKQAQSLEVFERVADGLRIPGHMLGITRRPWEGETAPAVVPVDTFRMETAQPWASGQDVEPDAQTDVLMMLQEADRTDIGPGTIESLYTVFYKLCRDYLNVPAAELRRKLKRLYFHVMQLRQGRMTLAQHADLIAISGWITALLACVDWDMNQREAAEAARYASLRFAKEIGHSELTAWSYEMQAWFALTEGRYGDVVRTAQAAQSIAGENSATVQLVMQEARGQARLGNRKAAESAMERGYSLLQKLPPVDRPRHFVYDKTKFPFYVASCYQWLGDDVQAEIYAQQVFKECQENGTMESSPMRLAETNITLGLVYTQRRDLEAAVDSGKRALTYERKSGPSLLIRAAELDKAIVQAFPDAREAREFDEGFKAVCNEFGLMPPAHP